MIATADQVGALLRRDTADPHAILGAHPAAGGVVIRALRPSAEAVAVVRGAPQRSVLAATPAAKTAKGTAENGAGSQTTPLRQIDPAGVFEGVLDGATLPLAYELRVDYGDAGTFTQRDPYSFTPTLGELDLYLIGEGRHERLYELLGAHVREHEGVTGTAFAVWAPAARAVNLVGDFNFWNGVAHPMRSLGSSGIWELFVPGVHAGGRYKFEIVTQTGEVRDKADPYAQQTELPPATASVVARSDHFWSAEEAEWAARRRAGQPLTEPLSIYEVHLGSWRRNSLEDNRSLTYSELADELAAYVLDMGFTHVELLPVMAHPFEGSWGYQVTGYFAPSPRYGSPDDLRGFVQRLHAAGVGVILDWVPGHFPRDDFALARFDGTSLYEHADPRRGSHPEWGTLVFNYGRHEVRNFLIANALFWLREYHVDGLRVDAVASMLYLDYSRKAGEWTPNEFGGREDLDAVSFLKELNEVLYGSEPGVLTAAEESTSWPGVSRPTYLGGLGFGFKWNMGWMHDVLGYFEQDPVHRRYHHHELTFSLVYAFTENFILPLSHDEVVHGKSSLYGKMAGDDWQKRANLRALYGFMWAHPGKKLLFMGSEFAQHAEWSHDRSLDWHLLQFHDHSGVQALVRDLNRAYRDEPALWELDFDPEGFYWLEVNDADSNVVAFARQTRGGGRVLVAIANLSPVVRGGYRVALPRGGGWRELVNTDSRHYGGGDVGNGGGVHAQPTPWNGQPYSAEVTLPPLAALWLVPDER